MRTIIQHCRIEQVNKTKDHSGLQILGHGAQSIKALDSSASKCKQLMVNSDTQTVTDRGTQNTQNTVGTKGSKTPGHSKMRKKRRVVHTYRHIEKTNENLRNSISPPSYRVIERRSSLESMKNRKDIAEHYGNVLKPLSA